jgi:acyl-CoA thioester hydrolase
MDAHEPAMIPADLAGRLTETGHVLHQRVYFEDTDFSGLVYHARYLHFLERGRSDWLRLLGVHHWELAAEGLAFAVRRMEIDFLRSARIDDVLAVETRKGEIGGARIVLRQSIRRDDGLLVEALVTVALLGPEGRPRRLPPHVRAAFEAVPRDP